MSYIIIIRDNGTIDAISFTFEGEEAIEAIIDQMGWIVDDWGDIYTPEGWEAHEAELEAESEAELEEELAQEDYHAIVAWNWDHR